MPRFLRALVASALCVLTSCATLGDDVAPQTVTASRAEIVFIPRAPERPQVQVSRAGERDRTPRPPAQSTRHQDGTTTMTPRQFFKLHEDVYVPGRLSQHVSTPKRSSIFSSMSAAG